MEICTKKLTKKYNNKHQFYQILSPNPADSYERNLE